MAARSLKGAGGVTYSAKFTPIKVLLPVFHWQHQSTQQDNSNRRNAQDRPGTIFSWIFHIEAYYIAY